MIGIFTFHQAINYGAILQAYALSYTLNQMGKQAEIIDYRCSKLTINHSISFSLKNPIGYFYKKSTEKKFHVFFHDYIKHSQKIMNIAELNQDKYNFFLVGSDQVWNTTLTDHDSTYYLDFCKQNNKKFSYAASMGDFRVCDERYYDLLNQFQYISVRENDLKNDLKSKIIKDVEVNIDPVMLLSQTDWQSISTPQRNNHYILIYTIAYQEEVFRAARDLSKRTGLSIYWLSDSLKMKRGIHNIRSSGPKEFVGVFQNAEYIVTNSFHGTAFAILFNKKFYSHIYHNNHINTRVYEILKFLNLETCQLKNIEKDIFIDWELINKKLMIERNKAKNYLDKLGDKNEKCS